MHLTSPKGASKSRVGYNTRVQILKTSEHSPQELITAISSTLKAGGLVIYPTETTYGIGADATNQVAVDTLLKYKKRREGKPLSVLVKNQEMAEKYVELSKHAQTVYERFLPGPVTVVSQGKHVLAKGVESEQGTLGIRISSLPFVMEFMKTYPHPVTATGANASYKKRPYAIQDIFDHLSERQKDLIDLVIDAGELPHNEPSTVIDTTLDDIEVLRQGSLSFTSSSTKITHSTDETIALGKSTITKYKNLLTYKALVFCLIGEMGAGKTQFCKGIAEGLGIYKVVSSPTFVLSKDYPFEAEGKETHFIHMDTWRLFNDQEFLELGFAGMIDACNVIAIEWADKVIDTLKQYSDEAKIVWITFEQGKDENERTLKFSDEVPC